MAERPPRKLDETGAGFNGSCAVAAPRPRAPWTTVLRVVMLTCLIGGSLVSSAEGPGNDYMVTVVSTWADEARATKADQTPTKESDSTAPTKSVQPDAAQAGGTPAKAGAGAAKPAPSAAGATGAAAEASKRVEAKRPSSKDEASLGLTVSAEQNALSAAGQQYVSGKRRDPFLNPLLLRKKTEVVDEDVDLGSPPPGVAGMNVAKVDFLVTSLREGVYTAVFRGTDKRYYFLHDNDRFFDGFVKAITGDSVTLVRETQKRSGKVEREEIKKQLRRQ